MCYLVKMFNFSVTHTEFGYYTLNKDTHKTLAKLTDWRKTNRNYRIMGSVWVLFLLTAHTRPI